MSETKHTPGPWHVLPDSLGGFNRIWSAAGDDVATCVGDGSIPREERAANECLIAAAPELLTALEQLLAMTQDGWITPEDKPTDWQLGWEAACEQFKIARTNEMAEAAIRKAKGE